MHTLRAPVTDLVDGPANSFLAMFLLLVMISDGLHYTRNGPDGSSIMSVPAKATI